MLFAPLFSPVLSFCAAHRSHIIRVFYFMYALLCVGVVFGAYAISTQNSYLLLTARSGKLLGQAAVIMFLICMYPGILGRFTFKHPLITIGIMFRRYVGISVFLLALSHALLSFIIPGIASNTLFLDIPVEAYFGFTALLLLLPLFLTSNDYAVKLLGAWWKKLHRLVYVIFWLIFLHVMFQEVGILAYAIGFSASLEVLSLLYDAMKPKAVIPPTTS